MRGPVSTSPATRSVEVRLPAETEFVSVLRTTAAALAARAEFTIDDIEELRMAIGEASNLAVDMAATDADLTASFHVGARQLRVRLAVPVAPDAQVDVHGFAWQILNALSPDVDAAVRDDRLEVSVLARASFAV